MTFYTIIFRILATIALCEFAIMAGFEFVTINDPWLAALIDCVVLTLMVGPLLVLWVVRPCMAQKEQENQALKSDVNNYAHNDWVTGLVNRDGLLQQIEQISETKDLGKTPPIFLFIDLDHFSVFSNSCGHRAADGLLKDITTAFQEHFRNTDVIGHLDSPEPEQLGRLGDDQFGLILFGCTDEEATEVAKRLIAVCQDIQFCWDTGTYQASCSIGLTSITSGSSTTIVMRRASSACHTAKDTGRGRTHFYQDGDSAVTVRHEEIDWVAKISHALHNDFFTLFQQTISPLHSNGHGDRFEVLLRLDDGDGPPRLPWNLIAAAERYDLVTAIDRWVITNTFATLNEIYGQDSKRQLDSCSINLSGATLAEGWLLELICELFDRYDILPNQICFEITETHAITNEGNAQALISQLRDLGCRFALDDFGSGLSSFPYLKKYKLDYLKIDGSLIKEITHNQADRTMVEAITMMAHGLNLRVVAEWVEDEAILQVLKEIGVDFGQGYLLAKPEPLIPSGVVTAE